MQHNQTWNAVLQICRANNAGAQRTQHRWTRLTLTCCSRALTTSALPSTVHLAISIDFTFAVRNWLTCSLKRCTASCQSELAFWHVQQMLSLQYLHCLPKLCRKLFIMVSIAAAAYWQHWTGTQCKTWSQVRSAQGHVSHACAVKYDAHLDGAIPSPHYLFQVSHPLLYLLHLYSNSTASWCFLASWCHQHWIVVLWQPAKCRYV